MQKLGLVVKQKRKFRITTNSNHKLPVAENILDRQFNPVTPNQVWAAYITYIWTAEGWLYLAVVIDLYSRRVIGWSMDKRQTKSLVIRALMMAVNMRKPSAGLIHHSDRGSQYASLKYQASLKQHGEAYTKTIAVFCARGNGYKFNYFGFLGSAIPLVCQFNKTLDIRHIPVFFANADKNLFGNAAFAQAYGDYV